MRWDGQLVAEETASQLPGMPSAVTRTFDAPEALDIRFHEIRTKSALNRVPEASRVPFRWTVNPYRGCTHACTYCSHPATPVLMGDGGTRPIAELKPGDEIYGTTFDGRYRRYARTIVLDHWSVVKPAFRVILADGTELISGGDHRYLTWRGWKYVTGAMGGPGRRPYLTTNSSLLGTGAFAAGPVVNDEYALGYLAGMIRGDGTLGSYCYERSTPGGKDVHRFRLALADEEALNRSERFLARFRVESGRFAFSAATETRRAVGAIRNQTRGGVARIRELIRFSLDPTDDWRKGFLAGIFDAEGHCSGSVLRVSNTDPLLIAWMRSSLDRFGFDHVTDVAVKGVASVRVRAD